MELDAQSQLSGHHFISEILNRSYKFRVLKLKDSLFIYIGDTENEVFDEMALAIPTDNVIGTTIIGVDSETDSREVAIHISRKLKKQVFVSCNVRTDNLLKPLLLKRLAQEIFDVPTAF